MNNNIFKMMDLKNKVHDIAIDFHDIPFYGCRDTPCIRGIKPKTGTSWGYSFCTLDIIGNSKLTLDVIDINGLTKDYQMKSVINQEITKSITDGIESFCNIPVKLFLDCLRKFNRERGRARSARLKEI